MKKYYSSIVSPLLVVLTLLTTQSKGQSFSWIKNAGDNDRFTWQAGLAVDHHHNEVVCGFQNDSTHFGSMVLPFYGDFDGYVAKYDSSGNVLWVRTVYGPNQEKMFNVAVDTADNIYVVGQFSSPFVHFTATDSLAHTAVGSNHDFFLAKYDKNGNFLWARHGGNPISGGFHDCSSAAIGIDPAGNAIIGGFYQQNMTAGSTSLTGGAQNLFLAKYDPTGTMTWMKGLKSNSQCFVTNIACDDTGNIYPTGKVSDSLLIGTAKVVNHSMGDEVFFGKFTPAGVLVWMDSIANDELANTTDNNFHCGNGILVDHSGNVYLGGSLLDTVEVITTPSLIIITHQDGFIAKYNNAGSQLWMQRYGDNMKDVVNGIAMDAAGGLYAIGDFVAPATFGGLALTTPPAGYGNMFIGKFDPATGNALWLKTGGGESVSATPNIGWSIAIDQQTGGIATAGYFEHKITFDATTVTTASTALSSMDMFVARQYNPVSSTTLGVAAPGMQDMPYHIYPNPANDVVTVDLSSSVWHKIYVVDMAGHTVMQTETNTNMLQLDIHALVAGMYTIAIQDATQSIVSQKLIKE